MKSVPLTIGIVSLIENLQLIKKTFILDIELVRSGLRKESDLDYIEETFDLYDWLNRVRGYYFSLNAEVLNEMGLVHNEVCFRALLEFTLTDVIRTTRPNDLSRYELTY